MEGGEQVAEGEEPVDFCRDQHVLERGQRHVESLVQFGGYRVVEDAVLVPRVDFV